MNTLMIADANLLKYASALDLSSIEAGLERYEFMGEEVREGEGCDRRYKWLFRTYRVWYTLFSVKCIEVKLLAIVICPGKGRTIRSATFEKCSFGSISPNDINRSDIEAEFKRLLGVDLPSPL